MGSGGFSEFCTGCKALWKHASLTLALPGSKSDTLAETVDCFGEHDFYSRTPSYPSHPTEKRSWTRLERAAVTFVSLGTSSDRC